MSLRDWLGNLFSAIRVGERLPPPDQGHGLPELARRLGIRIDDLGQIKPLYHQFTIPKRSGGTRTITAPGADFKGFQRCLLRRVIARLPVHPAATGFRKDHSIATHALLHSGQPVVVKMDIRDFFGQTSSVRVHAYFRRVGWNDETARMLVGWCTHDDGLPQGAPTSPALSNAVNYLLDCRLSGLAQAATRRRPRRQNPKTLQLIQKSSSVTVFYSRYADDLTVSFSKDDHAAVQSFIYAAKSIVENTGYRLHTRKKLRIMRQHDRQIVTGLVVNDGVNLPRETRRRLRAVEHRLATGRPASISEEQLQGWRALQHMIASHSLGEEDNNR